jgi:outer membrane protein
MSAATTSSSTLNQKQMRPYIAALILMLSTGFAASAQFQRGDLFLSGSLEFSADQEKNESKQESFVELLVLPRLGYFVTDKLALGLGLAYNFQREQYEGEGLFPLKTLDELQLFGPELSLRRYWALRPNFGLWLDFSGAVAFGSLTSEIRHPLAPPSESKQNAFALGAAIRPGAYLFVSPRLALEASLGGLSYGHVRIKDADNGGETASKSNSYSFLLDGNNLGLRLGLSWFLVRGEP